MKNLQTEPASSLLPVSMAGISHLFDFHPFIFLWTRIHPASELLCVRRSHPEDAPVPEPDIAPPWSLPTRSVFGKAKSPGWPCGYFRI